MRVQLSSKEWKFAERCGRERHRINRGWGSREARQWGKKAAVQADCQGVAAELAVYKALGLRPQQPFVVTDGVPPVHDLKVGPYTVDVKSVAREHYSLLVTADKVTSGKTCDIYVLAYVDAAHQAVTVKGWAWADDIFVDAFREQLRSGDDGYLYPAYLLEPAAELRDLLKVQVQRA